MRKATVNLSQLKDKLKSVLEGLETGDIADGFKLPSAKEFEIKMRDLNPDLQILFSETSVNEIVESRENGTAKIMMLCDIKSNAADIEAIKQQMYQQKMIQSNLLLDDMRKNSDVSYRYS